MYNSIDAIKEANIKFGGHWFASSNMKFFGCKVYPTIYKGKYFITHEDNFDNTSKLFSIREATPEGQIETVGEFQAYTTLDEAKKAIKKLV